MQLGRWQYPPVLPYTASIVKLELIWSKKWGKSDLLYNCNVTVNETFIPEEAMNVQRGSTGIALLFL